MSSNIYNVIILFKLLIIIIHIMDINSLNFDKYYDRIGIDRSTIKNDINSLKMIQLAHLKSIPFENLDVIQKKVISISVADCYEKLVENNRGGYCFEHNTLLAAVLESVGFQVFSSLARPRWNRPANLGYPQTHLTLIVKASDGKSYLVDVAFGGLQCLEPLALDNPEPQLTKDGLFRLMLDESGEIRKQWQLKGQWLDLYSFKNENALNCDLLMSNWWSCTWPAARWMSYLYVAKIIGPENERHYILNDEYVQRKSDGTAIRTKLGSIEEFTSLLNSLFGIVLSKDTNFSCIESFYQKGYSATFHAPEFISS